jgi:hypothetical protein
MRCLSSHSNLNRKQNIRVVEVKALAQEVAAQTLSNIIQRVTRSSGTFREPY